MARDTDRTPSRKPFSLEMKQQIKDLVQRHIENIILRLKVNHLNPSVPILSMSLYPNIWANEQIYKFTTQSQGNKEIWCRSGGHGQITEPSTKYGTGL